MKKSLFLVLILISSCSKQRKFNVELWNDESDRSEFHYRNEMLDDLIQNHHLKGKSVQEIKDLFLYFDSANNVIMFEVYQEWKGIDPSYTKYLNLRLNRNNIVDSVYITEYKR